jgi:carbonic anhydrase
LPLLRGHRAELWSDLRAGIALSLQSLPVALALALAADLAPWRGLVAAAAGGLVAALVGGVPLAVHGPVLALAVLLSAIAERHGLLGLIFAVAGCGALQIGTGVLRLGRFVRLVPLTVVQGFSAGVAVIVLIGQLPSALGLPPPGETHVFRVIEHLGEYVHAAQIAPIGIAAGAALVTGVCARFAPRLPAPLLGLLAATLGALALPVSLPSVASLADGFALLRPAPAAGISAELVGETLAIFAILSAVSLATATNTDRIAVASRHDADQELIGLGLSNVALGLFGALPIAAIASKSARHVERGARTRRAAVSSALALTLVAPLVVVSLAFVPIAALTGVLIALAVRGLELGAVRELWRTGRTELAVLVITALATVLTDLFVGVQAGVLIAVLIAATRVGRSRATVHVAEAEGVHFVALSGPLTFLDAPRFDQVREALARMDVTRGLVLDLRAVPALDSTGAVALGEALLDTLERGGHLAILGARAEVRDALLATPGAEPLRARLAATQSEVDRLLDRDIPGRSRLLLGVERFRREDRPALSPLFDQLADGQQPHTLFITCSDSRVQPNLLTHTDPGELFIVRNIGALVPPSGSSAMLSEPAAIEYAVAVLGVKDVVVCGHSSCGAVRAVFKDKGPPDLENFQHWMASARTIAGDLSSATNVDQAVRRVAQQQLAHLRSYAPVRERVARGELRLHAWFYDLGSAELFEFDTERGDFVRLGERRRSPDAAPSAAAESVA